jgi:replicative DNA helicase
MDENNNTKIDDTTLRKYQFDVISALYHYGSVFRHQIRNIVTPECLINEDGRFYYQVFSEIIDNGFEITDIFFQEFAVFLGYKEHFQDNKDKIHHALQRIRENKVPQKNAVESARILARRCYKNKITEDLVQLQNQIKNLHENTPSDVTSNTLVEFVRKSVATEGDDKMELLGVDIGEYIDDLTNGEPSAPGINIGLPLFEAGSGGILPGTVTCISARLKVGKSSLCLNIAANAAKNGIPTLFLDMEMQRRQIQNRLLANISGVNLNTIKYKTFNRDPVLIRHIEQASEVIEKLPLTWRKASTMNVDQYLSYVRRWLANTVGFNEDGSAKECLVVLDYIKLSGDISANTSKKDWELLGETAGKLKDFANEYGVPVVTAVQLNRTATQGPRGNNANIGGSDRIAQYVDTVWELSKKTTTEIAQDNADLGEYCGNVVLVQTAVRDAESLPIENYLAMDFNGGLMRCSEKGMKFDFMKVKEKPVKKEKPNIEIPV